MKCNVSSTPLNLTGLKDKRAMESQAFDPNDDKDGQNDVLYQIEMAYKFDKLGDEVRALHHYEAAMSLTIPSDQLIKFSICYGSTLSNNSRFDDAIINLKKAASENPMNAEALVFLSLALKGAGRIEEAYSTLLKALVLEAGEAGLGGFSRAVSEYLKDIETEVNDLTP